jgi:branched-chain amino acid transport system ATP-binding protein
MQRVGALIHIKELTRRFGGVAAVEDVSFQVAPRGITGLIGPNGAGKSTLLALLAGQLQPHAGAILLDGRRIDRLPPHRRYARGVARTFQIPRPFRRMSVLENLLLARPAQEGERLGAVFWAPRRIAAAERRAREHAFALLGELGLKDTAASPAGELSGGQHKLLELARALMASPRVLLLDEPCAGVNPVGIAALSDAILRLRDDGMTFIIVEHNVDFVVRHCDEVVVMAQGRVLTQGTPDAVRRDPRVLEAFLGDAHG